MSIKLTRLTLGIALVAGLFGLMTTIKVKAGWAAQIPTGYAPTVTGSPVTAYIFVLDNDQGFANVRSGPGTLGYEIIGVLVEGQQVPAIGRTVVGDWILIDYPGVPGGVAWVWKDLVEVRGNLPIISPPDMNVIIQVPEDVSGTGFQPDEVMFDYVDRTEYVRATY